MRKASKPSPTESPLLSEVDPEPASEMLTALGGMLLVVLADEFRDGNLPTQMVPLTVARDVCRSARHGEDILLLRGFGLS